MEIVQADKKFTQPLGKTSELIREGRYWYQFFTRDISHLYITLSLIACRFDLEITELVILLLENLYNDKKFHQYQQRIKLLEQAGNQGRDVTMLMPIVEQYSRKRYIAKANRKTIQRMAFQLEYLPLLASIKDLKISGLTVFYIDEAGAIKFYTPRALYTKIQLFIKETKPVRKWKWPFYSEYCDHVEQLRFRFDYNTRSAIEVILTYYYSLYVPKMISTHPSNIQNPKV